MDNLKEYILKLRRDFGDKPLSEETVDPHPVKQFEAWFTEAVKGDVKEPNAMTIATVENGIPACRVVLLRDFDEQGLIFFTNYMSDKARGIEQNPQVCLNFFWAELDRQVRVNGKAARLNKNASDAYFASRPRESQIGAWASPQSTVIPERVYLTNAIRELEKKYDGQPVPRPPHWGGYLVEPFRIEFWQGRPSRVHDRILYERNEKAWKISRLAP